MMRVKYFCNFLSRLYSQHTQLARAWLVFMICLNVSWTAHGDLSEAMQNMQQARQELGNTFWSDPNGSAYWIEQLAQEIEQSSLESPSYASARYELGLMHVQTGNFQSAAVEFEQALDAPNAQPADRLRSYHQLIASASQAGYPVEQTLGFLDGYESMINQYYESGIMNEMLESFQVDPGSISGMDQLRAVVFEVHAQRIHDDPANYGLTPQQADLLYIQYMDDAVENYLRFLELAPSDPNISDIRYDWVSSMAGRAAELTANAYESQGNIERALEIRQSSQHALEAYLNLHGESSQAPELASLLLEMVRHTAESPEAFRAYAAHLLASGRDNYSMISLLSRMGGELAGELDTLHESTLLKDMVIDYIRKWQPDNYSSNPTYQSALLQSAWNSIALGDFDDATRRLKLLSEADQLSDWISLEITEAQEHLARRVARSAIEEINAEIAKAPVVVSQSKWANSTSQSNPWDSVSSPRASPVFQASPKVVSHVNDDVVPADSPEKHENNYYLLWALGAFFIIVLVMFLRGRK